MNMLAKMLERQEEVNVNTMGEDWSTMGLDWRLAIMQETSELVDSFPWKWWKSGKIDYDNAKIEVVDIWHFVMSMMIEEGVEPTDIFDEQLKIASNVSESNTSAIVAYSKELVRMTLDKRPAIDIAMILMTLSGKIGLSYEMLTKLYFGKAVLNDFRQANGYKSGSYIKEWNGEEDNEIMKRMAESINFTESFYDDLYGQLTEEYMLVE
jgi:dimeric dUTPase (all-alpha-NTP-PPase superfamily)